MRAGVGDLPADEPGRRSSTGPQPAVAPAQSTDVIPYDPYVDGAQPGWFKKIVEAITDKRRAIFLLHFNIRDIVFDAVAPPPSPDALLNVAEFLRESLRRRDLVLTYSLHGGVEPRGRAQSMNDQTLRRRAGEDGRLWEDVARAARTRPYPLTPVGDHPREPEDQPQHWRSPALMVPLLSRMLTTPYRVRPTDGSAEHPLEVGLIVDYLHHLAPAPGMERPAPYAVEAVETIQRWSVDRHVADSHRVFLLAPSLASVHPELRDADSRVAAIRIDRPISDERQKFLAWLAGCRGYERLAEEPGIVTDLANRASGMNYQELREFSATISQPRQRPWAQNPWDTALRAHRAEVIQRESRGLLEPKESQHGLDAVAGYGYVKAFLERLVPRLRSGDADLTGLLFAGPPGTGKSFVASALARDAAVNVVMMRNLRGSYVGESERNLEHVLDVARSLAPVVMFVDEIDQAFASRGRGGGDLDGGVDRRLLGRLLEFMEEKENLGKVVWIAASNRPDLIDAALLSRFKVRIPFLLPDLATCLEMLESQLPAQANLTWEGWGPATPEVERLTREKVVGKLAGRELETLVRTVGWQANPARQPGGRRQVGADRLVTALSRVSSSHDRVEYLRQSLLALEAAPEVSGPLTTAVREVLPEIVVRDILDGDDLNKEEIVRWLNEPDLGRAFWST